MKTTTPYDILQSELIGMGHSEFTDDEGNWVFHNKEYQFIQKMLRYDDTIHEIITNVFFQGLSLKDETNDKHFKRSWITKFYNRQIQTQTLESFSSKVIHVFLVQEEYLNRVYTDLEKYLTGEQMSESKDSSESITMDENSSQSLNDSESNSNDETNSVSDNRSGSQSQAQNKVSLNIDNHVMDWADDFSINRQNNNNLSRNENTTQSSSETSSESKNDSRSESESENLSRQYNMENLEKMTLLLEQVFLKYDKECFLQIW